MLRIAVGLFARLRHSPTLYEATNEGAMIVLRRNATAMLAVAMLLTVFNHSCLTVAAQSGDVVMGARIDGKLNTKNAKVGDTISAKILKAWKLSNGTDIPKGSKITGKVAAIKSKKDGGGNSTLSFQFDEIDVKGSAPIPIHGIVVAIGPSLAPKDGLGAGSDLGRNTAQPGMAGADAPQPQGGGRGSKKTDTDAGFNGPNTKDYDDIPMGSTMPGVSLAHNPDADGTTVLSGNHEDIDLDSDVLNKVQLK